MQNSPINESRLEVLERWALNGEKENFSAAINGLSHKEMLAYLDAMKKDFDRLHALDPNFPELIIYGHDTMPAAGRATTCNLSHRLNEIDTTDASLQLDAVLTKIPAPAPVGVFYWLAPPAAPVIQNIYDPKVPPFTRHRLRAAGD